MADTSEPTVDALLHAIAASVKARDFTATADLLRLLAVRDPQAAGLIVDALGTLGPRHD